MATPETYIRKAFELMRHMAANPEQYPRRFVALPLDSELISGLFTPERIRLLKLVRERGPYDKVEDLARAAHRDVSVVSRDLKTLSQAGLVATSRRGKRKVVRGTNRPIVLH